MIYAREKLKGTLWISYVKREGEPFFCSAQCISHSVSQADIYHLDEGMGTYYILLYLFSPSDSCFLTTWSISSVCFFVFIVPPAFAS